jgi:hypothetical protein
MTFQEKQIYNTFLKVSRSKNKLPFKYRKNFEDFDAVKMMQVKKLAIFFKKFPHIKMEDYFFAPYSLYPDETYFDLNYYTSLKATKSYTLFNKKITFSEPDSNEQLLSIKESLRFVLNFCREKRIDPINYIHHKTNNEYSFVIHLKEHKVNIYVLLGYINFEKVFKARDAEIIKFILGEEFFNNISTFKTKLLNSNKALSLVNNGLRLISEKFKNNS